MTRPPRLPLPVPFPVYGLGAHFEGQRNLVSWNQPEHLSEIWLSHGALYHPGVLSSQDVVTVVTLRKDPAPSRDDDRFPPAPIGLDLAALYAISHIVDRRSQRGKGAAALRAAMLDTEIALIERTRGQVRLRDWLPLHIDVDGTRVPAHTRRITDMHAVAIDLPDVVVAITADHHCDVAGLQLVDVRGTLDDYPRPSIRDKLTPPGKPTPAPTHRDLLPLYLGLHDILANARDGTTNPAELLARIEYVADALLRSAIPRLDQTPPTKPAKAKPPT